MALLFRLGLLRAPEGDEGGAGGGSGEGGESGGAPPAGGTQPPVPKSAPVVGRGGEIPPERISEIKERERLAGAREERRKFLLDEYGTDDEAKVAEIKKQRQQDQEDLKKRREEAEKQRQAEMSDLEKAREEAAREKARADAAEAKFKEAQTRLAHERQDVIVTNHASRHVASKYVTAAKVAFSEYVEDLTQAQLKELTPAKIDKWFEKYAKDNPALALQVPPPKPKEGEEPPEGKQPQRQPPPPKRVGGQPPKAAPKPPPAPGPKPVSKMSGAELNAHYKKLGFKSGKPY